MMSLERIRAGLLVPILVGLPCLAGAATLDVELRPRVTVPNGSVLLGDVAHLRSDDFATLKSFMAVPLGHSPRAGTSTVISRETLMRWVNARLRLVETRVTWGGASEVAIQSVTHELPGFLIEQTARASLTGWLKQRAGRYSIEPVTAPRDLALPPGQPDLRVRPLPAGDAIAARQRVWVDIHVNGEFVRAVPVDFSVAAYGEAWVAPHGLARGATFAAASLERREVSLTHIDAQAAPMKLAPAAEMRSRKTLAPGAVVDGRDVEPVPAVSRGEQVTLMAGVNGLELETRAEALQDGQIGQAVRVRTAGAPGPVIAQVIAPGRVRLQP